MTDKEFYEFYLSEHTKPLCRLVHCLGVIWFLASVAFAAHTGQLYIVGLGIVGGYFFGWFAHRFIEKNIPTTVQHPLRSVRAGRKMYWDIVRGKLSILPSSETLRN